MPPLFGDRTPPAIPDVEILGELGRGGMGVVYKARKLQTGQIVAVKVIRKDRLQHEEAVRRFRREAQAAARMRHPNIVQVFDSDHAGELHYLVMEFVDGVTLERLVELQGPLSPERACDFVRQTALGLQHAHEMALVHRDVKPSNLMVTPVPDQSRPHAPRVGDVPHTERGVYSGERGVYGRGHQIKILDLGVARLHQLAGQTPESLSTLTQGGSVIGTADYVAPEQLENPHAADIRADLYSLGCTFYFLLTGRVPFPGGTLISKLDKHRWESPTSIHQLRDNVPGALVTLVQRLMAKRPEDRFRNPAEVARGLEQLTRGGYGETSAQVPSLEPVMRLTGHDDAVLCAAYSPDGKTIASGGKDRRVILWDAGTGTIRRTLALPQEVRAVAFLRDGAGLLTASGITVRLWDLHTGQEMRRFSGHAGAVAGLAVLADGRRFASAGKDKTIRVWELQSGQTVQRLARHTGEVAALCAMGEDSLASGSRDQTIRLWDLRSGQETSAIATRGGAVFGLAVSRDGELALSGHFDTVCRLWDLRTGQEIRRFLGHKQMVSAVTLTPDETRFVSAGQDHIVRLWNLENGCELACLQEHKAGVYAVAVSPDGTRLLTAGADKLLGVWELPPAGEPK